MIYFLRGNIFTSFTTVSRVPICFQRICNIENRFSYANSASCVLHVSAAASISICRQAVKAVFSTSMFVMFSWQWKPLGHLGNVQLALILPFIRSHTEAKIRVLRFYFDPKLFIVNCVYIWEFALEFLDSLSLYTRRFDNYRHLALLCQVLNFSFTITKKYFE